jgi:tRNA(Arg) A34 adenosine deaminase TadA
MYPRTPEEQAAMDTRFMQRAIEDLKRRVDSLEAVMKRLVDATDARAQMASTATVVRDE